MSHVALARHQCPICGELHTHDTEILLDKRLKEDAFPDSPNEGPITGHSLCKEHTDMFEQGMICFIELDGDVPEKLSLENTAHLRTGRMVHMPREAAQEILDMPDSHAQLPFTFCDKEFIPRIEKLLQDAEKAHESGEI